MKNLYRALFLFSVVLAFLTFMPACGQELDQAETNNPDGGAAKTANVEVFNDAFRPASVTIATGGTVTWKNRDAIKYSVSCDGHFDQVLDAKGVYSHTFNTPGTFHIYDKMQSTAPSMTVIVK